jgi:hypothetical protein
MKTTRRLLIFIPVETQRSRRAVVVGYYIFFIALAILFLWFRGPAKYALLLPLTYLCAAMLGGLTVSGPVRLFSQWQRKFKDGSALGHRRQPSPSIPEGQTPHPPHRAPRRARHRHP